MSNNILKSKNVKSVSESHGVKRIPAPVFGV